MSYSCCDGRFHPIWPALEGSKTYPTNKSHLAGYGISAGLVKDHMTRKLKPTTHVNNSSIRRSFFMSKEQPSNIIVHIRKRGPFYQDFTRISSGHRALEFQLSSVPTIWVKLGSSFQNRHIFKATRPRPTLELPQYAQQNGLNFHIFRPKSHSLQKYPLVI